MAAPLNPVKAKMFKTKLDRLGCPYTEDVKESWISELLFKPGESRIRLLQWLFSKFDSKLNEILDPEYASVESKMDSRLQQQKLTFKLTQKLDWSKIVLSGIGLTVENPDCGQYCLKGGLLYVASTLGLCRHDDVDLIRGAVTSSRQTVFMEHLIDLVCIADGAEDPKNKMLREPGMVCDEMPLEEQLRHDLAYLNNLCNHGNIELVFKSRLSLLPTDLMKVVEDSWTAKGHSKDKPPRPDMNKIESSATQLADDIQRQKELLEELRSKYEYQRYDKSTMDTICKTISIVLSELSDLVTSFTYCFENEMKHWCDKNPPALTQLGPAFKRVHRLLKQFVEVLHGFRDIRKSYTALYREDKDRILDISELQKKTDVLGVVGEEALESLQEVVDVLEESILHSEVNSSLPSTPRSVRSQASTIKKEKVSPVYKT